MTESEKFDIVVAYMSNRSVEVLENSWELITHMRERAGERRAQHMVDQYCRTNGIPPIDVEQFIKAIEAAANRVQLKLDPDTDQADRVWVPKDELGYFN